MELDVHEVAEMLYRGYDRKFYYAKYNSLGKKHRSIENLKDKEYV